ncbi:MAG TPA: xanthine dehydrogenase family protein molybdopterin-binding subunit [Opitutaceae bacterium]|nr:xanthine dehydrogenase family protein molybdopterin-binding subunit [Opitutaceae bacterium]
MPRSDSYIGSPHSRVDGPAKVTGRAKYAAEYHHPGLLQGYIVNSPITRGRITAIHSGEVLKIPGVIKILTHENRQNTAWMNLKYADMDAPPGVPFKPLHDATIRFNGQPVALVIAESFEVARYAASVLRIDYAEESHATDVRTRLDEARKPKKGLATFLKPPPPKPKGKVEQALAGADVTAGGRFYHGIEHHNPMELFASTVIYEEDGKLTIFDKTQGTINSQLYVKNVFGKSFKDVRVLAPYVGGAFGSGLRPQYQLFLAVLAALDLQRSVRVTMNRHQMFTFGHRPATVQHTNFGATGGKVVALQHDAIGETSRFEDYTEIVVNWANMVYPSPHVKLGYQLVPLDVPTPTDMRAPGGVTGQHAIECTIDELAHKAGVDPIEFRLKNYSLINDADGKPYSSKELAECFLQGAAQFGWKDRNPLPRSMTRNGKQVGWGMASGIWEAMQVIARAEAVLTADGKLTVRSAVTDIGTGTWTIMTQLAADCMGMNIEDVTFELGDSRLPFAPIQGGSFTSSTVGVAVKAACDGLKKKLFKRAVTSFPERFGSTEFGEVNFSEGRLTVPGQEGVALKDIVATTKRGQLVSRNTGSLPLLKLRKVTRAAHSAAFVEVEVDEDFGHVKVTRAVTAVAAGKIMNPKTARSQILGGMVWGISKALREETIIDHRYGRVMNANLAEYHTPVHADIHQLDVIFVEERDEIVNELGVKGVGEIGIVGLVPAIANAIFHATGRRVRDLPITLDKVMRQEEPRKN